MSAKTFNDWWDEFSLAPYSPPDESAAQYHARWAWQARDAEIAELRAENERLRAECDQLRIDCYRKQVLLDDAREVMERQITRRKELTEQVSNLQAQLDRIKAEVVPEPKYPVGEGKDLSQKLGGSDNG